ncbi:PFfh, plastid Ffh subunit of the signal recognition particle [Ectocarpus siliculosus]|uniref:signal-recognition-particle GTPase n=1 Tax=Ectocarpus siliculosus TaxID=2880 RepID=D8LN22_ECTSI|nr:PFfh, plastid Ffh subunit of the signal recognition particle [Ectocarpus siliculosus]|eukprot:CBN76263.1 PFfh, plastid Ffh subunit of the signal recognition particle [Ectocarpus siliculosus]
MIMASLKHRSPPRGGAAATLSFFCCVCALFAQSSVAFVPAGGLSRCGVNDRSSSSCRAAAIGAAGRSSLPVSRSSSRRGRRGGCAGGASSPLGMMFDTLAENMAGVANLFTGQKTITESSVEGALNEVKRALLDADLNLMVTNTLVDAVKSKAVGMKLVDGVTAKQQFVNVMNDELVEIMGAEQAPLARRTDGKPTVILLAGLQGTGKTTAAAKLAKYLQQEEEPKKVLLVAGDVYRPAAIDQLISLGKRIDVEVFSMGQGVDPVEITKAGLERAVEGEFDTVIVDTAGRQVVDDTLMTELKDIQVASEADEVLLVVDAMTGQEAATLASVFNEKIGITGAVLTKMDGDTRGGAALSVQGVSQKPIKFVGIGEKMSEEEAAKLAKKMINAEFDFNDFLKQAKMMKGMGSLGGVANMIPGMAGKITPQQLNQAEEGVQRAEGLIKFMTPEERRTPKLLILDPTSQARCRRIARDAGVKLSAVSAFLKEFQAMQSNMSRMGKQMADGDPNAGPGGQPSPFQGLGGDTAPGAAPSMNRQQRRQSKKNKAGRSAAPSKGFG